MLGKFSLDLPSMNSQTKGTMSMHPDSSHKFSALSLEDVLKQNLSIEDPDTTPEEGIGSLCEAKTLYKGPSKCDCCINWVEEYPVDVKASVEKTLDAKRHAIICRVGKSHNDSKEPLELHSIIVQSPVLKSILGDIFTGYPGITTTLENVEFHAPFWEFLYRWDVLAKAGAGYESESSEHKHVDLLIATLSSQLGSVHSVAKDLIQNNVITYDYLWVLFAPGTLVYSRLLDQDCLFEVEKTKYYKGQCQIYVLHCKYIEWDGEDFGWQTKRIKIEPFSGTKSVQDLDVYPITRHNAPEDTQSKLLERGRKFVSINNGLCHRAYRGIIMIHGESCFELTTKLRVSFFENFENTCILTMRLDR